MSSRPTRPIPPIPTLNDPLTPLRAHYLKKYLIQQQFHHELTLLIAASSENSAVSPLSYLGSPFSPPPRDAPTCDLPLLKFVFRNYVLSFPFLAAAPRDFWAGKVQPFIAAVLARQGAGVATLGLQLHENHYPVATDDDDLVKKKLLAKIERNLSLFIGAATKLVEKEEVVRLTQADLDRLEKLAERRKRRGAREKGGFDVNVVGVRTVVDKGRMRSRAHEEFLVRTKRPSCPDIVVSRRYGDFRTLATELQKAHPDEPIRPPPPKDRTIVKAPASPAPSAAFATANSESESQSTLSFNGTQVPSRLAREKNRLTLRSYLHALLSTPSLASSPVLKSFLLSGPITLTHEELEDARRREEADQVREEGRRRFAKEIQGRVEGLREAVRSVKGDVMGKDGLTTVFGTIKVTQDVRDLPENYQAVTEWARISLASTVFHQFVASDNASESFAGLKRIHGLMPYFMLKAALKISNPISMIRSVLDLFLAQPFGGRSLLQRMFTSSLTEEVRALEAEIEAVKDKVEDPIMCAKIKQFVYAPREIQEMFKADAAAEKMNILTVVLRSAEQPILSREQMHRLARAHRAHTIYLKNRALLDDSDDDDGPQDEDAWLLEDLKILAYLYSRLRDREQLIALVFEGFTSELLKDIITIFYSPLAQVYRAASIADSLNDMQNFINDLIKTVEQVEELSQEDPHRTVQAFIDLIQRHEQSFYHFVHKVHSKGENLFDSLMRWIELFLTVVREGVGEPISLEFLLPHTGSERAEIFAEVDEIALYHYKLKVLYEDKLRRRFGRATEPNGQGRRDADAEDEATQALVNGVVGEISFGELVQGDAIDLAAEETDEEGSSSGDDDEYESSSEYETASGEDTGDETTSSSGQTESEESVRAIPSRSNTVIPKLQQVPRAVGPASVTVDTSSRPSAGTPPSLPHKRSLSLRSTRSMNFSLSSLSLSRRSQEVPPPVPALPFSPSTATRPLTSKPLPPSPTSMAHSERPPPTPSKGYGPSPLAQAPFGKSGKQVKKKPAEMLKPPELVHIPKLLPVFVELMKPLLAAQRPNVE